MEIGMRKISERSASNEKVHEKTHTGCIFLVLKIVSIC